MDQHSSDFHLFHKSFPPSIVTLIPSGLPSQILTCTELKRHMRLFVLVSSFLYIFWLHVLDKAEYSAFESTLNSSIVSFSRITLVQSAVLRSHVVCLSVRPSVTLVNCDHIGWNSLKIISPLVSLGRSLFATLT